VVFATIATMGTVAGVGALHGCAVASSDHAPPAPGCDDPACMLGIGGGGENGGSASNGGTPGSSGAPEGPSGPEAGVEAGATPSTDASTSGGTTPTSPGSADATTPVAPGM
jgi:hypothetical protein